MNIQDYCDILNVEIKLTYYPNQQGRWCARFDNAEIKCNGCLSSEYGDDISPTLEIKNYIEKIKGKTIVFYAMSDERKEYVVPTSLEA